MLLCPRLYHIGRHAICRSCIRRTMYNVVNHCSQIIRHRNTDLTSRNMSSTSLSKLESSLFVSGMYQDDVLLLSLDLDFEVMLQDLDANLRLRKITNYTTHFKDNCRRFVENREKLKKIQDEQKKITLAYKSIIEKEKKLLLTKDEADQERAVLRDKGKHVKAQHNNLIAEFYSLEQDVIFHALQIPNHLHKDTPAEDDMKVLQKCGSPEKVKMSKEKLKETLRKCVKFSNIGQRSYYLMLNAALKEQELITRLCSDLRGSGFTHMVCPEIFKTVPVEGAGIAPQNPKEIYNLKVQDTNKDKAHILPYKEYIRGTSVVPFLAYFTKHLLPADDLPRKFFTIGRSYDVEQETNSLPGLYGAPQNICAEVAAMTKNNVQNEAVYDQLQTMLWNSLTDLDIPARMVLMPAHSLHSSERKRTEVQFWSPSLQQYVEVGSLSCYGDYHSRRLMFRQSGNLKKHPVSKSRPIFTIHGRWANITRLVALHLEYSCQLLSDG